MTISEFVKLTLTQAAEQKISPAFEITSQESNQGIQEMIDDMSGKNPAKSFTGAELLKNLEDD